MPPANLSGYSFFPTMTEKLPICSYEGSDYQTSFWEQGGRDYEDQAEAIALTHLLPKSGMHLLELGAGAGRNSPRYKDFQQVTLVDYSVTQLQQAQKFLGRNGRYRFVAANVYHLPFMPASFDAATMIRTLHHLVNPRAALDETREALTAGGAFILEYANKRNLKAILRYSLRRQAWNPFSPEPVEFAALNFDFHPATVRSWLLASRFAIEEQRTVSHLRLGLLKRLFPARWLAALDGLLQPSGNLMQYTPSVFLRARTIGNGISTQPLAINGALFRCPACRKATLADTPPEIVCPACGHVWLVKDGIYDFRVD